MNTINNESQLSEKPDIEYALTKSNLYGYTTSKPKFSLFSDRFIPNRISSNLCGYFMLDDDDDMPNGDIDKSKNHNMSEYDKDDQNMQMYTNLLQEHILGQSPIVDKSSFLVALPSSSSCKLSTQGSIQYGHKKLFKFKSEKKNLENVLPTHPLYSQMQSSISTDIVSQLKVSKRIPKAPFKIIDAPNLQDDFYLNLLDWSPKNIISVGLDNAVYIWPACNSKVTKFCEISGSESTTAVSWSQSGIHLAVGTSLGEIQIYDVIKNKLVRVFNGHEGRVGSISWNGYNLCSGSRDRNILVRDVRSAEDYYTKFSGHKQEICGLKWSFDENLLASGGNDNKLFIWSLKHQGELTRFSQHQAAVKAIGWSPHQHNILASGGGTADKCIRFWNMQTLEMIDCIDTGSQVCNLTFSKNVNELVSTHGYSLNQINVWKYPTMQNVATLTGHTYRVLYLAMSPCGQNIITGAGDETIRFWNLFPPKAKNDGMFGKSSLFPSNMDLRQKRKKIYMGCSY